DARRGKAADHTGPLHPSPLPVRPGHWCDAFGLALTLRVPGPQAQVRGQQEPDPDLRFKCSTESAAGFCNSACVLMATVATRTAWRRPPYVGGHRAPCTLNTGHCLLNAEYFLHYGTRQIAHSGTSRSQ